MIKILRVDDRLLHGHVAVAWTNYYKADVILIANNAMLQDKAAGSFQTCDASRSHFVYEIT